MTRTVDDAARMMAVLASPDERDATSLPPQLIAWERPLPAVRGLRIGLMQDAGCGMTPDPQIADAVGHAAGVFEQEGAQIVPVAPVLSRQILDGIDSYWRARCWADLARLPPARRDKVLPYILQWAAPGAAVSGPDAIDGFNRTFELRRRCAALFAGLDALLSPTTPNLAFPAEWASPLNDPQLPFEHIAFTLPWNMSEQPALSLNCGFSTGGTPIGLQSGPRRSAALHARPRARWCAARRAPIRWPAPPPGRGAQT